MASLPRAGSNREFEAPDAISSAARTDMGSAPMDKKDDSMAGDDEETASKRIELPLDAFGDESNAEVQYKTMSWWQASMSELSPPHECFSVISFWCY